MKYEASTPPKTAPLLFVKITPVSQFGALVSQMPLVGLEVVPPGPAQFCGSAQAGVAQSIRARTMVNCAHNAQEGCFVHERASSADAEAWGVCGVFMRRDTFRSAA